MQTIFVILTAITIAVMAKKRGRSPWGWGIIGAVAFLVIDSVVALLLIVVLWDTLVGTTSGIYTFAAVKLVLFSAFVAVFNAMLTHATVPPPTQALVEQEGESESTAPSISPQHSMSSHVPEQGASVLPMMICPFCKVKVLPRSDGTCPSCQSKISP